MRRNFHTLDVFTDTALAGNPLAVVLDSEGLDDARMQGIAREFNLPETVFVLPPQQGADVRIRTMPGWQGCWRPSAGWPFARSTRTERPIAWGIPSWLDVLTLCNRKDGVWIRPPSAVG